MDSAMESESEVESETGIESERQSDGASAIEVEGVDGSHRVRLLASALAALIETMLGCVSVSQSVQGRCGVVEKSSDLCAHARESEIEIQRGCLGHAGHPRYTALARTEMDTTGRQWQLQHQREQTNLTDD